MRLPGYDYRTPGAYFVTICTHQRRMLFNDQRLVGIVAALWHELPAHFEHLRTDAFIVMPNHLHGILWLRASVGAQHAAPLRTPDLPSLEPGSLSVAVRSFKAASTRQVRIALGRPDLRVWQRNYYDRVVRNEQELNRIREYVITNPERWLYDRENPSRIINLAYDRTWGWLEGDWPEA